MQKGSSLALGQACPGSEQEGPARVAQCPHKRRSGARGRCLFAHRGKPGWHSGAVFEAPALVAGFDDFAGMGQPVEECRRHLGVAKDAGPFAKSEIGGDNDRGSLVDPADQMKQELSAGLREGQESEFVEDNKVRSRADLPSFASSIPSSCARHGSIRGNGCRPRSQ